MEPSCKGFERGQHQRHRSPPCGNDEGFCKILRCHVWDCSTAKGAAFIFIGATVGGANQSRQASGNATIVAHQNVVRLEITVNNPELRLRSVLEVCLRFCAKLLCSRFWLHNHVSGFPCALRLLPFQRIPPECKICLGLFAFNFPPQVTPFTSRLNDLPSCY
jgi:hypothetical protein